MQLKKIEKKPVKLKLIGADKAKSPEKEAKSLVRIKPNREVEVVSSEVSIAKWWNEKPRFQSYTCARHYEEDGLLPIEPMTAKEETREDILEKMLSSNSGYYVEEKFDGTRATLHFLEDHTRVFSRRISKKTNWYAENSDSVPHLRDIDISELNGTIIDGEMFIPNRPFKDVSSTLNCKWDKAIERQKELGQIVLNAFDIIYFKGENVTDKPLWKRKEYLKQVVDLVNKYYGDVIREVRYSDTTMRVYMDKNTPSVIQQRDNLEKFKSSYPELFKCIGSYSLVTLNQGVNVELSKKAYYDFIVANGGEGIILKDKNGKYYHKRGREYTKVKKFLTREVVVIGFDVPTKLYDGKTLSDGGTWDYWGKDSDSTDRLLTEYDNMDIIHKTLTKSQADALGYYPLTKHFAQRQVGNIKFGVVITSSELDELKKSKKGNQLEVWRVQNLDLLLVGDCGGFDDEQRLEFTKNQRQYIGTVIEVLANEIFLDTGKLRHPRFLRIRQDKEPVRCTWKDHIGG